MALIRLAVLGMLIAASFLAACSGRQAPLKPTAAPRIEGIVSPHVFKVETANASPAVQALNAEVEQWRDRRAAEGREPGSGASVTGDMRAVVASRLQESGEYEVTVWRTARGDQLSGALPGRPFARQSSENFLLYESEDSSEHIVRLDNGHSFPIPSEIQWVEVSRDGKWLGISGDHIVAGRIGEYRLFEDLRIRMPDGAPSLREHFYYKVYWLPQQNAALLATGVLVNFDPAAARLLEIGSIVGVVEEEEAIVHQDESARRLFASRICDDGSLSTEPLDHDPIRNNWRVWALSPSGHYAVARYGMKGQGQRLIRIRQFPAWGSEFPRRDRILSDWLVIRNDHDVVRSEEEPP